MASKANGVESEWARAPPPNVPIGERFLKAIYNPDDKTFLGRTPKRWGIVIIFYAVFYAVLALMFAICMAGLYSVLENNKPVFTLESSLIGTNPGVACRPQQSDEGKIRYSLNNFTGNVTYINELQEFFEPYLRNSWYQTKKGCKLEDKFGYPDTPCIFVKLNRIYGWKPDYIVKDFPKDMSPNLTEIINSTNSEKNRQQIWISCWEEYPSGAAIEYPWGQGLPEQFYPFVNQEEYINPLVAVQITPVNSLTVIRCRAWANNIIYNKSLKEPSGFTRILLEINDLSTNATVA